MTGLWILACIGCFLLGFVACAVCVIARENQ